jgi:Cu-Zn family superoxide dismutase
MLLTGSLLSTQPDDKGGFMKMRLKLLLAMAALSFCGMAQADITVEMNMVDDKGIGKSVGQVIVSETPYGVVFTPSLAGLPQGLHGFHLHENPSCEPKEKDGKMVPALAAGGHYDPAGSKRHGLSWGDGHLGDLPALFVDAMGNANNPVLAPRLKITDIKGRSLMIHAGGDDYADLPSPLGGGGARIVCGVIP